MKRQESNQELLDILQYLVETNPDLRFGQILQAYGFVKPERPARPEANISWQNDFYTEPAFILKRVRGKLVESDIT